MPILEHAKRTVENLTGVGRPAQEQLARLLRKRKPLAYRFADDGFTPNHPRFPLLVYRSAVKLEEGLDPAAIFEDLFAANGWKDSWRNGIYDFRHFHTGTHEVLGIARGTARVEFGGLHGKHLELKAGDVAVLPAGTGHKRLEASDDLLVVGAYPMPARGYDEPAPSEADHKKAVAAIAKVPLPKADPVYGRDGPLITEWQARK
jgi:uncharacterized protein YjlB